MRHIYTQTQVNTQDTMYNSVWLIFSMDALGAYVQYQKEAGIEQ